MWQMSSWCLCVTNLPVQLNESSYLFNCELSITDLFTSRFILFRSVLMNILIWILSLECTRRIVSFFREYSRQRCERYITRKLIFPLPKRCLQSFRAYYTCMTHSTYVWHTNRTPNSILWAGIRTSRVLNTPRRKKNILLFMSEKFLSVWICRQNNCNFVVCWIPK